MDALHSLCSVTKEYDGSFIKIRKQEVFDMKSGSQTHATLTLSLLYVLEAMIQ